MKICKSGRNDPDTFPPKITTFLLYLVAVMAKCGNAGAARAEGYKNK